jgi:oligoendopeptidase F
VATTELTGAEDVAWDLSDLYDGPGDPRLEEDLAEAERAAAAFRERHHGQVGELDAKRLAAAVADHERIDSIGARIGVFAYLRFATDMADPERGALLARIQEKGAQLETQLLFFGLEWAALEDGHAEELLASPALEHWRHYLRSLRKFRPYLLTEPEERIVTEKTVTGSSAWSRFYSEQLSAIRVDLDGEQLSLEQAMSRLYSPDRDTRAETAAAVTAALEPGLRTRGYALNTIILDHATDDRLRGYPTWVSARNLANETTDDAVQALVDATVSRYDLVQRYYRLKARLLRLERLEHWDRFAPLAETESKTSWDEARRIVLDAYAGFAPEAGDIAGRFFDESWIDAPPRPDKSNGAFCATTVPGLHPYVLLNYTGEKRSILTLAHELGHGLHGVLAEPLGLYNSSTPLTTAETASVFGEALTFKVLLAAEDDPRARLDLLTRRIEDAIGTVFRQVAMNRFEERIHQERRGAGEIAPDRFGELWLETQQAVFGDAVRTDGYSTWWSYIGHFASVPGYVYAYAYGYLFALAIFRKWEQEGDALVQPYLDLLRSGGSKPPEELAGMVGLDLTDPAIWSSGIDALAEEVAEAERLAAELD